MTNASAGCRVDDHLLCGHFFSCPRMVLNVSIPADHAVRAMLPPKGVHVYFQASGGVGVDSAPSLEHGETHNKAGAMVWALEVARSRKMLLYSKPLYAAADSTRFVAERNNLATISMAT